MQKEWRPEHVAGMVALVLAVFYNTAFWHQILHLVSPDKPGAWLFLVSAFFLLVAFFNLVLTLLPFRWGVRPLLTLLLPLSAAGSYFMNQYSIVIDGRMMQNVLETDLAEMLGLLTWKLLLYFFFLGVLPVVLLWRVKIKRMPWWEVLKARALGMVLSVLVIGLMVGLFYQSYASVARNHRELRFFIVPNNFLKGLMDYLGESRAVSPELTKIGLDAQRPVRERKRLFVLVIGETARAANFSLNGYGRQTNPELAQHSDVVNYTQFGSCGTETAVSLPCLMSGLGREEYSLKKARSQENLLDVVKRSGIDVLWIDNQSGCKQTCDRVPRINTTAMAVPDYCRGGECHDGILVAELKKYADTMKNDTLVVLHQMGSHGPAYYLRYPETFRHFTPECRTSLLDRCSREAITNSYDNTIRYTDHVLARLVSVLRDDEARFDTGMLYVSDHGESLGEYGLYLHGYPYALAPDYQKHVPALIWLSPALQQSAGIDATCLMQGRHTPYSHDNVFHSVLGVLDISTSVYQPGLDIFAPCRKH